MTPCVRDSVEITASTPISALISRSGSAISIGGTSSGGESTSEGRVVTGAGGSPDEAIVDVVVVDTGSTTDDATGSGEIAPPQDAVRTTTTVENARTRRTLTS
jgi:hypothetical protein